MKALISVIGKDRLGIISNISALLAKLKINIEDISQTVLKDTFSVTIKVEMSQCKRNFEETALALSQLGKSLDVDITIQEKNVAISMEGYPQE